MILLEVSTRDEFNEAFDKGAFRILQRVPKSGEYPEPLFLVMWFVDRMTGKLAFKESDDDPREFDRERYEAVWVVDDFDSARVDSPGV